MSKRNLKGIMIPIGLFVLTFVLIIGLWTVIKIFKSHPVYEVEVFEGTYRVFGGLLLREDGQCIRIYDEKSGHTAEYPIQTVKLADGRETRGAYVNETLFCTDDAYCGLNTANTPNTCLYVDENGKKFIYSFKNKNYTPLFEGISAVSDEYATGLLPLSTRGTYFVEFKNNSFCIVKRDKQKEEIAFVNDVLTVNLSAHNPLSVNFVGWLNDRYFAFTMVTREKQGDEKSYFICDASSGEYQASSRDVDEEIFSVSYIFREKDSKTFLIKLSDEEETVLPHAFIDTNPDVLAVSPEHNYLSYKSGDSVILLNLQNGQWETLHTHSKLQIDTVQFLHRCVILVTGSDEKGNNFSAVYRLTF